MDQREYARRPFGTAVVIGGSIGGSVAAAALSNSFERVIVLDRDELPSEPRRRKGTPHGHQFHALTIGGRVFIEELFPGFSQQAVELGAQLIDRTQDIAYLSKFGFLKRGPSEHRNLLATRTFLEWRMRTRTRELNNVEIIERSTVTSLVAQNGAVVGVEMADAERNSRTIMADLVIDTSGRSSLAPKWFEAMGYPAPAETTIDAKWGYTSAYIKPDPSWNPDFDVLYVSPTVTGEGPQATRGAAMWRQEGGVWVLTAQGCGGDLPPSDEAGYRDFLGSFGRREFTDLLETGQMIEPPVSWRTTTNRMRDFAGLATRPENFIVLGDAVAAFNPVYGQGMASAAQGALLLSSELPAWFTKNGQDLRGFAAHFQQCLHDNVLQQCWVLSTGADLQIPGVELNGAPQQVQRTERNDYMDRLMALCTEDLEIMTKFAETTGMLRGMDWIFAEETRNKITQNWDRLGKIKRLDAEMGVA
ncbi:FAD binding domain protein [Ochrobactrum quorumnocens]|uniref:FAD binding domain protein n=1 Tax=Ochrobactrum quorumnocens TaxID=271865 RepID=A0A248UDS3_9HYPH|nr:hypothetical protein [[Ochrobactrum] quorumnocens]ASV84885.1 FAD binding domain protein [[Ochrobactrum] quorumnocens]